MQYCQNCGMHWDEGDFCPYCGNHYTDTPYTDTPSSPAIPQKNPSTELIVAIAAIIVLMIAFSVVMLTILFTGFSNYQQKAKEYANSSTQKENTQDAINEYQQTGIYPNGSYAVGSEIPPGEYVILCDKNDPYGNFPISVYSDAAFTNESKLYMVWAQNCHIVELEEGQYIHFSHAVMYDPDLHALSLDPFSQSGMYRVGEHIEPGTYTLCEDGSGNGLQYTIYSSISNGKLIQRDSGTLSASSTLGIVLQEGEYLSMQHCYLSRDLPPDVEISTTPIIDTASDGVYPDGTYAVGEDIPAGAYFVMPNNSLAMSHLYVVVYPDASMNEEDAAIRGWLSHFRLLELKEGQYIETIHANLCDMSKVPLPYDPFTHSGMYLVGEHLEPGTYTLISDDDQYGGICNIYSGIEGTDEQTLSYTYISSGESEEITLQEGQYIEMEYCHLQE